MSNSTAVEQRSLLDIITRVSDIFLMTDTLLIVLLYVTGVLGALLNIVTFLQRDIRHNACSLYFLSTSVVDLGIMQVFLLMEIITRFNKPLSTAIYSTSMWCKLGNYITFVFPCLTSTYITLASIDRFCVSSLSYTLRRWSRVKVSRVVVAVVFVVWALFGLHIPIAYDLAMDPVSFTTRCTVQTGAAPVFIAIDGFFFALFNGAVVPGLLAVFGALIIHNVRKSRRRVTAQQDETHHHVHNHTVSPMVARQNVHMIKMLLVQVIVTVILNTPYVILYLLGFYRRISLADLPSLLLYIIFSYIARWFYYMNFCKTFYINTLTSALFRNSLRTQCVQFIFQRTNINPRTILSSNTNPQQKNRHPVR